MATVRFVRSSLLWGLIASAMAATAGCKTLDYDNQETRFVFELPTGQQAAKLATLPLETQYRVYVYGTQKRHPPAMYLADVLAAGGKANVKFLQERLLESSGNDLSTRDVIYVFGRMQDLGTYDVTSDSELFSLIAHAVGQMRDKGWKDFTRDIVLKKLAR